MERRYTISYKNGNREYITLTGETEREIDAKFDQKLTTVNNPVSEVYWENRKGN